MAWISTAGKTSDLFLDFHGAQMRSVDVTAVTKSLIIIITLTTNTLTNAMHMLFPRPTATTVSSTIELPALPLHYTASVTSGVNHEFKLTATGQLTAGSLRYAVPYN